MPERGTPCSVHRPPCRTVSSTWHPHTSIAARPQPRGTRAQAALEAGGGRLRVRGVLFRCPRAGSVHSASGAVLDAASNAKVSAHHEYAV